MQLNKALNSTTSWTVSSILIVAVLTVVVWSLNKGMIFSDEAYFVFRTVPGIEKLGETYWNILYSPFILENYVYTKYLLIFLTGSTAYLMGYSAAAYLKFSISPCLIGIWSVITQFAFFSPTGITPNHTSINLIILNLVIASLSFYLLYKKNIFLFLLGFFFSCLTFVFITSNIFIVPLLIFLFLFDKNEFWKNTIFIVLGGLTLYSIYFVFLQSPQEFYSGILKAIDSFNYEKAYSPSGLLIWHKRLIWESLIPLILIGIAALKYSRYPWIYYPMWISICFYLIYLIFKGVTHEYTLFPLNSIYFLSGLIIVYALKNKICTKNYFAILLIVLPYFASFGTDVHFFYKSIFYFPFILVGSLFLGSSLKSKLGDNLLIGFLLITIVALSTFFTYPFRSAWAGGYRLIDQNREYEFKGSTLFFDNQRYESLTEAKPYLQGKQNVLVSHPDLWGYVLILDAKPLYYHFKFNDYTLKYIEENQIPKKNLLLLEDKKHPFPEEMIQKLLGDKFALEKKVELSDFNIFTLEAPTLN